MLPGAEIRAWLESLAKFIAASIAAIAVVAATLIGASYESKLASVTLLSQREDAESRIRSSMFQSLVQPVIGLSPEKKLDPERYRVLVELLTLNFHDQFEVKPLLSDVDRILAEEADELGRDSLQSIARRVIDRQITSLSSTSQLAQGKPATVRKFFFKSVPSDDVIEELCQEGTAIKYAALTGAVCSVSPDGKYYLQIHVSSPNFKTNTVRVGITVCKNPPPCIDSDDIVNAFGFDLTHFDFPLTDNSQIDPKHRFAISLYSLKNEESPIIIKLVWFPVGFITARERPMNYLTLRRALGVGDD